MNVNERIARALGWLPYRQANPQIDWASMPDYSAGWGWQSPEGKREAFVPDYAHSLDACLPVLAALREMGLHFDLSEYIDPLASQRMFKAYLLGYGYRIRYSAMAPSPATALAECIARALETNEQNH